MSVLYQNILVENQHASMVSCQDHDGKVLAHDSAYAFSFGRFIAYS
jgi:hypothetical protein